MNSGRVDHKTKMISVRLSEAEFEFLKTQYQSYGARNASDLARLAVQRMMPRPETSVSDVAAAFSTVAEALATLRGRVSSLEDKMIRLWERAAISEDM